MHGGGEGQHLRNQEDVASGRERVTLSTTEAGEDQQDRSAQTFRMSP